MLRRRRVLEDIRPRVVQDTAQYAQSLLSIWQKVKGDKNAHKREADTSWGICALQNGSLAGFWTFNQPSKVANISLPGSRLGRLAKKAFLSPNETYLVLTCP